MFTPMIPEVFSRALRNSSSQDRGFEIVRVLPAVQQSQSGAGDHSYPSLVGYGRGQSGKGDTYPHSSLDNGYGGAQISYFERFHISVAVS